MEERRRMPRPPASKSAKLIIAGVDSAIDCLVHDLSENGACLQVAGPANLPPVFELQVEDEGARRACRMAWQYEDRIGVVFRRKLGRFGRSEGQAARLLHRIGLHRRSNNRAGGEWAHGRLEALQCALDEIAVGVVLLDSELRAQFINRAFRKMWQLTDEKAEARPAFIALMYHGRDIGAYELPKKDFPAYLAERVAAVKAGDTTPRDIRLANGELVRFQCAVLPNDGRMLSYTALSDRGQVTGPIATVDGQTGLANRRQFMALAEAEWERQARYRRPLSLMMIEIDEFATINDRFGAGAAENALALIAKICDQNRRGSDVLGRLGAREFALLLPETGQAQARRAAERLRRKIAELPLELGDASIGLTVSIGIAEVSTATPDASALMKLAERTLHVAKAAGGNRVEAAGSTPKDKVAAA